MMNANVCRSNEHFAKLAYLSVLKMHFDAAT